MITIEKHIQIQSSMPQWETIVTIVSMNDVINSQDKEESVTILMITT